MLLLPVEAQSWILQMFNLRDKLHARADTVLAHWMGLPSAVTEAS